MGKSTGDSFSGILLACISVGIGFIKELSRDGKKRRREKYKKEVYLQTGELATEEDMQEYDERGASEVISDAITDIYGDSGEEYDRLSSKSINFLLSVSSASSMATKMAAHQLITEKLEELSDSELMQYKENAKKSYDQRALNYILCEQQNRQ